jgi:SAM-dependent methyltransferase
LPQPDWNARYAGGDLPWDTGQPDPNLVNAVRSGALRSGRALEVGCGTGTNALWLAAQGFEVTAVDLSPLAIDKARHKAAGAHGCSFAALDFLVEATPAGPFDVVFDRGCFHVFDEAGERTRFAERAAACLGPGGQWLSLVGSTEGGPRDGGPPRRTAREVLDAVEPVLELVELRSIVFDPVGDLRPQAWLLLARKRALPASPSTRRG